jgi:AraC family transcriptional regulator
MAITRGRCQDMETQVGDRLFVSKVAASPSREWVDHVITLLDTAASQLPRERAARHFILEATSLLRKRIDSDASREVPDGRGRLLAWQARIVRDYIDAHITSSVLVADLSALIQRSEAHFSRSFKRSFGETPHAFVIRRRVELAAQYMLQSDASLSDIALKCGFTDQAHLCKHFRQSTGQPPGAWRRARRTQDLVEPVWRAQQAQACA